jgi:hypothetical protein
MTVATAQPQRHRVATGEHDGLPVASFAEAAPYLRRPFTVAAVKFKPQQKLRNNSTLCVAYIDARLVIERLNLVVAGAWHAEFEPVPGGLMWAHLTVCGVTRRDVGQGQGKALVSDALKRAAVHFGVGVSLYAAPARTLPGEVKYLNDTHLEQLRGHYARWLNDRGISRLRRAARPRRCRGRPGRPRGPARAGRGVSPEAIDDAIGDEHINRQRAKELVDLAFTVGVQSKLQLAASHTAGADVGDCSTKAKAMTALQNLTVEQADRVEHWISRKADEAASRAAQETPDA